MNIFILKWLCSIHYSFIHSDNFNSASSCPLTFRGAPDTARILCRSFMPKRHKQLWVNDLPNVPTWRLERDLNPQPFESTNEPSRPTIMNISLKFIFIIWADYSIELHFSLFIYAADAIFLWYWVVVVVVVSYPDYREPPWSPNKYNYTTQYWHVVAAQFSFLVVFEVSGALHLIDWCPAFNRQVSRI